MAYLDSAHLATDEDFSGRLSACICEQAQTHDPGTEPLAAWVLAQPASAVGGFMPFVSTAPGFGEKYATGGQAGITDNDLLAAVQACWDDVAEVNRMQPQV